MANIREESVVGTPRASAATWEVYNDIDGNRYFYNALTGESVWVLPPEEEDGEPAKLSATTRLFQEAPSHIDTVACATTPDVSAVGIAVEVVDAMLNMLEIVDEATRWNQQVGKPGTSTDRGRRKFKTKKPTKFMSPAAEARARRNDANDAKRRKRERAKAARAYLQIALSYAEDDDRLATSNQVRTERMSVGALFSLEDSVRWRLEREVAKIQQRRVRRKERLLHQHHVLQLKRQREMRQRFHTALTTHVVRQIECSSEVLKQRILLLSSPQREEKRSASLEPEVAERLAKEEQDASARRVRSIEKVFVLMDEGAHGKLHLLQILFGLFTLERVQQYAMQVRGLVELIHSQELQKFVVDFVSSAGTHDDDFTVTMADFVDVVTIIEDAVDHSASLRLAVKEAEDEIDAATVEAAASSAPGLSRLRARVGIVSKKQVELEIAALRVSEEQVRQRRQFEQRTAYCSDDDDDCTAPLLAPKEEWVKHHHHRFIRFSNALPLYCCLCRRRKWDFERRAHEEAESVHRSLWPTRYTLRMKEEELKLVAGDSVVQLESEPTTSQTATTTAVPPHESRERPRTSEAVDASASVLPDQVCEKESAHNEGSDDQLVVRQVVRSLVALVERVASETPASESPKRRGHTTVERSSVVSTRRGHRKDRKSKPSGGTSTEADAKLQLVMKTFESEESERKAMHAEEGRLRLLVERGRRAMERPLLNVQDAAYNAYIRALTHIVDPCSFLYRLEFAMCLSSSSSSSLQMTLLMVDRAEHTTNGSDGCATHYVLHTLPCRSASEADRAFKQLKILEEETMRSPHVARVASVSSHTFQFFADSGMLVECWPILFVATEYFGNGPWVRHFHDHFLHVGDTHHRQRQALADYARMERHVIASFRQVAAGVLAMHRVGVYHLNLTLDTIFVSEVGAADVCSPTLKLAGFLACKASYDHERLETTREMQQCIRQSIAPPELFQDGAFVPAKADVWMLGCALYAALRLWQTQLRGSNSVVQSDDDVVVRFKTIEEVLEEIPICASATIWSLLSMLLQPDPAERPDMDQVLDLFTAAETQ